MHNIEYRSYNENVDQELVQKELDHYVAIVDYMKCSKGLGTKIRWLGKFDVCKNYEDAEKLIDKLDRGWYDCLAVRYFETDPNNKKSVKWLVKIEYHT